MALLGLVLAWPMAWPLVWFWFVFRPQREVGVGPQGGDGAGPDQMGRGGWTGATSAKGSRIKDHGPCFGPNEHPRRDTDVILRLTKSTIEDLPFYIGFIS